MTSASLTWTEADSSLCARPNVPAALANLAVLRAARRKWLHAIAVHTSMHDLLFVMPGSPYPFPRSVRVTWDGANELRLEKRGLPQHTEEVTLGEVDAVLDRALQWLVDGTIWCTRCGGQVVTSANEYVTFEKMHWICFHYEFEHGLGGEVDVDADCGQQGCPSGNASRTDRSRRAS